MKMAIAYLKDSPLSLCSLSASFRNSGFDFLFLMLPGIPFPGAGVFLLAIVLPAWPVDGLMSEPGGGLSLALFFFAMYQLRF